MIIGDLYWFIILIVFGILYYNVFFIDGLVCVKINLMYRELEICFGGVLIVLMWECVSNSF